MSLTAIVRDPAATAVATLTAIAMASAHDIPKAIAPAIEAVPIAIAVAITLAPPKSPAMPIARNVDIYIVVKYAVG
jgi:hypothetical protein